MAKSFVLTYCLFSTNNPQELLRYVLSQRIVTFIVIFLITSNVFAVTLITVYNIFLVANNILCNVFLPPNISN